VGGFYFFDLFDERLRVFKVSWCGRYYLIHKVIRNSASFFRYAVDSAYDRLVDYWVLVGFGEAVCACVPFRLFQRSVEVCQYGFVCSILWVHCF
jgi:hypothetical protein